MGRRGSREADNTSTQMLTRAPARLPFNSTAPFVVVAPSLCGAAGSDCHRRFLQALDRWHPLHPQVVAPDPKVGLRFPHLHRR